MTEMYKKLSIKVVKSFKQKQLSEEKIQEINN